MSEPVNVTLILGWTYGVPGAHGRTDYVGPGRVTLPLSKALALGGSMATAVYHFEGKPYTAETLHEAPEALLRELRRRGVNAPAAPATPETVHVELALRDIDGVGEELAAALTEAGYTSVAAVAGADPFELTRRVAGVGPKSAPRLIDAAAQLSDVRALP